MSELRKDPVIGRWVIVASERSRRPSDFVSSTEDRQPPENCPFCEGHESMTPPEIYAIRSGSGVNKPGWQVRVVPNKFPALGINTDHVRRGVGMYDQMSGFGAHEVVIETPNHDHKLHQLSTECLATVMRILQDRLQDLQKDIRLRYILIFKNEGSQAGASLSHSHTQLIATPITPIHLKQKLEGAESYFRLKERCVYCDIIEEEKQQNKRIIYENDGYLAICPFASCFPFEIHVFPKRHQSDFFASRDTNILLADMLKIVLSKVCAGLNNPPYNFIVNTAPNRFPRRGYWATLSEDFHWHIDIIPRLTKVAGFEWGSGFYINPTLPEEAAEFLAGLEVDTAKSK
ncbi:MAG: DUF4931 domain-containing protein [Candidatus Omnitrophica bacterium]|nr:DUF4931 domain-containing protein [Candidatus Omnitrophota bacterium]